MMCLKFMGLFYYKLRPNKSRFHSINLFIKSFYSKRRKLRSVKINMSQERNNYNCENSYDLPLINDVTDLEQVKNSIVMIETSGNSYLNAR